MADIPDDLSSLGRARERLYSPGAATPDTRASFDASGAPDLPHAWESEPLKNSMPRTHKHIRLASLFFFTAFAFFVVALAAAAYLFYSGSNSVSVNNVSIVSQGPTTIAGGDAVPLSLTITNKNSVAISNAVLEISFPPGSKNADNLSEDFPRYTEDLGSIEPGQVVTRSIKAVVFGGEGQEASIPISLSYGAAGSSATFVKRAEYVLAISSTPLSISVDAGVESVSGKPFTTTLTVRSNATVPLQNVVVSAAYPFGFAFTSATPAGSQNNTFLLGTLAPGSSRTITINGVLSGQQNDQRVFRFTVGTAKSDTESAIAVAYMSQDATVAITAPFIQTTFAINGETSGTSVLNAGARQSVTLSYTNTLTTAVTNAVVRVVITGSAVDYSSIQTNRGFYDSATRSILFSRDSDPALAVLAPGASGIGTFTFATLPAAQSRDANITFTLSVSGTRVGQANVPEQISASLTRSAKVAGNVVLGASSLHSSGPFANTGPIPPVANQPTTYTIVWSATATGSPIADGTVSTKLPGYVTFANKTSGQISYDAASRTVSWSVGDIASGASAQASFQVSLTPSTSQKGTAPALTGATTFSGYDRGAGVPITTGADAVTTETVGDPGYSSAKADVQ